MLASGKCVQQTNLMQTTTLLQARQFKLVNPTCFSNIKDHVEVTRNVMQTASTMLLLFFVQASITFYSV